MTQGLIILGVSARAAAFSALRGGYSPYAIDWFGDTDLRAVCPVVRIQKYPHDFAAALAAAPDWPWIYTGGLENYPRLVDRMAKVRRLLGNTGESLRGVRNPHTLLRAFTAAGLSFPPILASGASPPKGDASTRWLAKPLRSGGGLEIDFAEVEIKPGRSRRAYLQQYIEGEPISAVFVASDGKAVLLGASRQIVGRDWKLNPPFLYIGSIGPLALRSDEENILRAMGHLLARQFQLTGLFNIDLVRSQTTLWPVEVNPRYSASVEVLERVTRTSFIAHHMAACASSGLPEVASKPAGFAGKAVVYASKDGFVSPALCELVHEWNQPDGPSAIADIPAPGEAIKAGQPIVTVFADGNSLESVEKGLRERAQLALKRVEAPDE